MAPVKEYMTSTPHSTNSDVTVDVALKIMAENNCRHLPVLHDGELVGILSDRDLELVGLSKNTDMLVKDLMNFDPYICDPDTPVNEVASKMLEMKISSAIVSAKDGEKWGIFTVTDALKIISQMA